jgi:hypothetical protein
MSSPRNPWEIDGSGLQRRLRASARQVLAALVLTLVAIAAVVATISVLPEQRDQHQAQNAPGVVAPSPSR